ASPHRLDEPLHLSLLALVLAAPRLRRDLALPGPDGGGPEVVEQRVTTAAGGVHRLLREPVVPAGEVGDGAGRAGREPEGGLHVALLRAADGVDLLRKAVGPPAQRVDEVAALAGEPGPFGLLIEVPAVGGQLAGVDEVAGVRRSRRAA